MCCLGLLGSDIILRVLLGLARHDFYWRKQPKINTYYHLSTLQMYVCSGDDEWKQIQADELIEW